MRFCDLELKWNWLEIKYQLKVNWLIQCGCITVKVVKTIAYKLLYVLSIKVKTYTVRLVFLSVY